MGKFFTAIGIFLIIIGMVLTYVPGLLNWFGKLPGDIRMEGEKSFIFIPITSMIIVSVVLTLIINLFFRK